MDSQNAQPNPLRYFSYWGKARPQADGPQLHLLPYHCLDVAAVGRAYLQRSPALLDWLARQLGIESREFLIGWITFWLALHDLGKFSTSFQAQRVDLVELLQERKLPHGAGVGGVRHDSLGMQFWRDHVEPLADEEGWFGENRDLSYGIQYWARAVTGHHGQPPLQVDRLSLHFHSNDVSAALEFAGAMCSMLLPADTPEVLVGIDAEAFERASQEVSWWIAGLAVLADWIGSNADIFTYRDLPSTTLPDYWLQAQSLARTALSQSGVLPAERQAGRSFSELFPSISQPSPLQAWAATTALPPGPQMHLLEDVTGAGKTEAAITITHRLMATGCTDGFFIGLPTMATANAMYGRIAQVYGQLFGSPASLVLAHARKLLVEDFAASVIEPGQDEADPKQIDDSATRRCMRWLADHNKRALLAPAGVGTVDQALLGALQSKHQSLRLLGLMRKVLVIDEVHACDAYMQRTLETLLEFHAYAGGSAVLLSATLTTQMKAALLGAFARGCGARAPKPASTAYPLATSWSAAVAGSIHEAAIDTRPDVRRTVHIRHTSDRADVLEGIAAALAAGQCVAWIRNTVGDALEARDELAARVRADRITLFHARFTLGDRLDIEEEVLRSFGRNSGPEQRAGRLLIATQVAEQSLDVDFDLVVTDLAPIDRLIQRAGRLRRHTRDAQGRRLEKPGAVDGRGQPCLWVFGPAWNDAPQASWFTQTFPKSAKVYPHHGQLWLTAKVLQAGQFTMPDDARHLIETVFGGDSDMPEGLQRNANEADGKAYGDASVADANGVSLSSGYARAGLDWSADTVAPSRLGEDTVDVLIGKWVDGGIKPWRDHGVPKHAWAYSTVKVAQRLIASADVEEGSEQDAIVQAQLTQLPGGGRWVVLLAFEEKNGKHTARARRSTKEHQLPKVDVWTYDAAAGLRVELKESREEK